MAFEIEVTHGGGKKIDAKIGNFVIHTDQAKESGGEGSAPEPYMLFLASLATCAGIYVIGFCQARSIPTENIRITQDHEFDTKTGKMSKIKLQVHVPDDFPEKYLKTVQRAAALCAVKKTIEDPPVMQVETVVD